MVVEAGGLSVGVDVDGDGPVVVWVHGGLGTRAVWAPQVRALRGTFTCVTYDLRGHGETRVLAGAAHDAPAYTAQVLCDDLVALLDVLALGASPVHVAGVSVGGMVAAELAISHPGRVAKLVLADTWCVTPPVARQASPWVTGALAFLGSDPAAVRLWRALATHDSRARLPSIRAPTLIVAGERDPLAGQSELIRALIDGARLEVIPGAGHNTHVARPEAFTALVRDFLSR